MSPASRGLEGSPSDGGAEPPAPGAGASLDGSMWSRSCGKGRQKGRACVSVLVLVACCLARGLLTARCVSGSWLHAGGTPTTTPAQAARKSSQSCCEWSPVWAPACAPTPPRPACKRSAARSALELTPPVECGVRSPSPMQSTEQSPRAPPSNRLQSPEAIAGARRPARRSQQQAESKGHKAETKGGSLPAHSHPTTPASLPGRATPRPPPSAPAPPCPAAHTALDALAQPPRRRLWQPHHRYTFAFGSGRERLQRAAKKGWKVWQPGLHPPASVKHMLHSCGHAVPAPCRHSNLSPPNIGSPPAGHRRLGASGWQTAPPGGAPAAPAGAASEWGGGLLPSAAGGGRSTHRAPGPCKGNCLSSF